MAGLGEGGRVLDSIKATGKKVGHLSLVPCTVQTVQVSCAERVRIQCFLTYVMCIETGTACGMMSFFVLSCWLT
jgi:hypothetical protein